MNPRVVQIQHHFRCGHVGAPPFESFVALRMLIAIFGHADSSLSSAYKRRPHRRYQHLKYGKDSVSGVLESVLAQPITSKGLSLSRYFSSFAGMSIAFLVSVAVVDFDCSTLYNLIS